MRSDHPSQTPHPLLTIAIPTFNRARFLSELLSILAPQLEAHPEVELILSDNASADTTPAVCADFAATHPGITVTIVRHTENIGSDANFASCFHRARGRFFWLVGDDDILVPGALDLLLPHLADPSTDIVYATGYGFREDFLRETQGDPLRRRFHVFRDPRPFASAVNIMFTFISVIIVNRDQLLSLPHQDPAEFIGTNLVQLSWSLPLLANLRKGVIEWRRPIAGRVGNAHGYHLGSVFGEKLQAVASLLLQSRPELIPAILNVTLRRWFPSMIVEARNTSNETLGLHKAHRDLRQVFGRNPRYWLFTYPALALPLPAARLYTRLTAALSKTIYITHLPNFWRKEIK